MRIACWALAGLAAGCAPFGAADSADAGAGAAADAGDAGNADAGTSASCAELHAAQGGLPSDYYTVAGSAGPLEVYCDMTTAGGGWTLVARSVAGGGAKAFGWKRATGSVRDDTKPYSVDASQLAAFSEMLYGARGAGKAWDAPVYRKTLPQGFLATYGRSGSGQIGSTQVAGSCQPTLAKNEPTMLSRQGFVDSTTDHFYFSDALNTTSFGLWPDAWDTNGGSTCTYDGLLTGAAGMIFVR